MRKQATFTCCLVAFCLAMLFPFCAKAATPLDPSADASLTLHYQKEGHTFANLEISLHRVAEAFPDGTFELIDPFASYPINIHDIKVQARWKHIATTLSSYVVADQVEPDRLGITDEGGHVTFEHLETGLYLVREAVAENNHGTYVFNHFMIYVPTPYADGTFEYHVEANPKCVSFVPKTEYRVTKLWQDAGNQSDRPKEVTIEIYQNGVLFETQLLNDENNWSYLWYVSEEDRSQWSVVERKVSELYTVSVQQNGGSFTLINTHKSLTDIPDGPQTGDITNPLPYVLAMSLSGIVLILLSVYSRRKRRL